MPRRTPAKAPTYMELIPKVDAFSNAIIELEDRCHFSNQTTPSRGLAATGKAGTPTIFGFASTLAFAISDSAKIRQLGAAIDNYLFKIHHYQDINGV